MALGSLKGTLSGSATTVGTSFIIPTGGPISLAIGDLIYAVIFEQAAITSTGACSDNLLNNYTAIGAGVDAGAAVTGRAFYFLVTATGNLNNITWTVNGGSNNAVGLAAVIEGPFVATPIDTSPTDTANDNTTPFVGPATGTLAQAQEVVMCFVGHSGNVTLTATSPNLKAIQLNTASVLTGAIGYQLVAATTSVAPAWTSSGTPSESVYGTTSFKSAAAATQALTPGLHTDTETFYSPVTTATVGLTPGLHTDADAFYSSGVALEPFAAYAYAFTSPLYRYRLVPDSEIITPPLLTPSGVTPGLLSDTDLFYGPTITTLIGVTPGLFSDADLLYGPAVVGLTAITPSLLSDTDLFYGPIVSAPATNAVTVGLLSDTDSFYGPTLVGGMIVARGTSYVWTTPIHIYKFIPESEIISPQFIPVTEIRPDLIVDASSFYGPTLALGTDLNPSIFIDTETFFSPNILPSYSMAPSLFVDGEVVYDSIILSIYNLQPGVVADVDVVSAPNIATSVQVQPGLLFEFDTFYDVGVGQGQLVVGILAESDTFYPPEVIGEPVRPHGTYPEISPLIIDSTFIPPMTVTVVIRIPISQEQDISANLFADTDTLFGPAISSIIAPTLFVDATTFYSPVITVGAVDIQASLLTDVDSGFAPAVSLQPNTDITAGEFTDTDILYNPLITPADVNMSPGAFTDSDAIFSPEVAFGLLPGLFTDEDALFAPNLTAMVGLSPSLFADADALFDPEVLLVGGILSVSPIIFSDMDTIFVALVGAGEVGISAGLFTDADGFFAPNFGQAVLPILFTDADAFFVPVSVFLGLAPPLFIDTDTLYPPQLIYPQILPLQTMVDGDELFDPAVRLGEYSYYPSGYESQIGEWRPTGRSGRTGKRYRIYVRPE